MSRLTILIVDDERDLRFLLTETLKRTTARLLVAESVASAKEILLHSHVDLVVCDYHMGDGNGLDVLQFMKSQYLDFPFILCSSMDRGEIPKTMGLEFTYIPKSNMRGLLSQVTESLKGRG